MLAPTDPIEYLCIALGSGAALLFVFLGYPDEGKAKFLSHAPRVKNFAYVLTGGLATFLADWRLIAQNYDRTKLFVLYELSAVCTTLIVLGAISGVIAISLYNKNRHRLPGAKIGIGHALLKFWAHGLPAFFDLWKQYDEEGGGDYRGGSLPAIMRSLNGLMVAEKVYAAQPTDQTRSLLIEQILSGIVTAVLAQLPAGKGRNVRANYMKAIPVLGATPEQLNKVHFAPNGLTGCSHLLLLERYAAGVFTPDFAIPVHTDPKLRLPGAPETFKDGKPRANKALSLKFMKASKIPKAVRDEITSYMSNQAFRSFLSIRMMSGATIVGVVNIEAEDEVFDPGKKLTSYIGESLHPYCTILAYLVGEV